MTPVWSDARVDRLKVLYADGWSASAIAADLRFVSRNAVIGKVHRLGLVRRGKNGNYSGNGRVRQEPKPRKHRSNPLLARWAENKPTPLPYVCQAIGVVPLSISLLDLEHGDCRFPYGDGPFSFCGHPQFAGSSYCPPHHNAAWVKPVRQRQQVPA